MADIAPTTWMYGLSMIMWSVAGYFTGLRQKTRGETEQLNAMLDRFCRSAWAATRTKNTLAQMMVNLGKTMEDEGMSEAMGLWVLDADGKPVRAESVLQWGRWFRTAKRQLAHTRIWKTDTFVSTVFLGLDHRGCCAGEGDEPVLWETMVFRGGQGEECRRYTSQQDALCGHEEMVREVKEGMA